LDDFEGVACLLRSGFFSSVVGYGGYAIFDSYYDIWVKTDK
jgi:hypothetical protein